MWSLKAFREIKTLFRSTKIQTNLDEGGLISAKKRLAFHTKFYVLAGFKSKDNGGSSVGKVSHVLPLFELVPNSSN